MQKKHQNSLKRFSFFILKAVSCTFLAFTLTTPLLLTNVKAQTPKEYKLKAAFIYNFLKFTTWPEQETEKEVINVCILGKDPFGKTLTPIQKKKVKNIPIAVLSDTQKDNLEKCSVLFISRSEEKNLESILESISELPILTVSEIHNFASRSGAIGFIKIHDKIRLEINTKSLQKANLKVSSKLLELANIIE